MAQNMCKFILDTPVSELQTINFVLECNPEAQRTRHRLTHHQMILVSRGTGTFSIGQARVPGTCGDLIFAFASEEFFAEGTGLEYFYVTFRGQRANELFLRFGITSQNRTFQQHEGLVPFFRENLSRATEENLDILSECVLMYAFSRLTPVSEQKNDVTLRLIRHAETHFSDPGLSLASIGEEWGYSAKYLSDSFKRRMGIGFSRYLKTMRINHAVFLMEHGVESVKNVAFLCGFQDPLYFSKVFRDELGFPPTEYQKRNK